MQRRPKILTLCFGLIVLALAGLIWLAVSQQKTVSQLRGENQKLELDLTEVDRLRAEIKEAEGLRNQEAEIQRLREETKDLLRLRNEIRQIREQLQELETLRAANAQLMQAVQSTALTTNQAALVMAVRKQGSILGINIRSVNDVPGIGTASGALVMGIDTNSPVGASGLKVGDIIIRLDGRPIETPGQLQTEMLTRKPGEIVLLDVVRGETVMRFQVKTRAWPE